MKRWLVSSGVPKPANMRIVHGLPRYIVACGPRVNGKLPGSPRRWSGAQSGPRSAGPYTVLTGIPDCVSAFVWSPGLPGVDVVDMEPPIVRVPPPAGKGNGVRHGR